MTEEEFVRLAETYGGDTARWPVAQRAAAAAALQVKPELAGILAEAAALDCLLGQVPAAKFTTAQTDRVVRATRQVRQRHPQNYRRLALQAAAVVLCAGIGLAAGFALPGGPTAGDDLEVTGFLVFGPTTAQEDMR